MSRSQNVIWLCMYVWYVSFIYGFMVDDYLKREIISFYILRYAPLFVNRNATRMLSATKRENDIIHSSLHQKSLLQARDYFIQTHTYILINIFHFYVLMLCHSFYSNFKWIWMKVFIFIYKCLHNNVDCWCFSK